MKLFKDKKKAPVSERKSSSPSIAPVNPPDSKEGKGFRIPIEELVFSDKRLGAGGFGAVKVAKWNGTEVAVKFIPKDTTASETTFKNEVQLLANLHHPNIVQLYGFCVSDEKYLMVLELVREGDLQKLIHDPKRPLDVPTTIEFLLNICRGMIYLHHKNILHRDMKPGNILVAKAETGQVKITDFGLSKATTNDLTKTAHYATPLYAAPELASDSYDEKVDVFSFAIIMWEIFERKLPFSSIKFASEVQERVRKGERPSPFPETCPKRLRILLEKCWAQSPAKRPGFTEIHNDIEAAKRELLNLPDVSRVQVSSGPASGPRTAANGAPFLSQTSSSLNSLERPRTSSFGTTSSTQSMSPVVMKKQTEHETLIRVLSNMNPMTWQSIQHQTRIILRATASDLEKLKFLFDADINNRFISFIDYFSPFLPEPEPEDPAMYEGLYETNNAPAPSPQRASTQPNLSEEEGYRISEIATIVSLPGFQGFVNANDAANLLKGHPEGTYMLRFSRDKKYFCLDAVAGVVRHWRIERVSKIKFWLPNQTFPSLLELVSYYQSNPLPVAAKDATSESKHLLVSPLARPASATSP